MTKLTEKEFNDLYGDVEVEFTHYYKFMFTFVGTTTDGNHLAAHVGGGADEIYKLDVTAGEKVKVRDLYATYASVSDDAGETVHYYTEY